MTVLQTNAVVSSITRHGVRSEINFTENLHFLVKRKNILYKQSMILTKTRKFQQMHLSFGPEGVLLQKQEDQTWRPVMFISRALTPMECRYVQIEKEALALTRACE